MDAQPLAPSSAGLRLRWIPRLLLFYVLPSLLDFCCHFDRGFFPLGFVSPISHRILFLLFFHFFFFSDVFIIVANKFIRDLFTPPTFWATQGKSA